MNNAELNFGRKVVVHDSVSSTGVPFSFQYLDYAQDIVFPFPFLVASALIGPSVSKLA